MAEKSSGVVVTERMLTEAARVGDLDSLTIWARQGVRVTFALPLIAAAASGRIDVLQCLVRELGADVNYQVIQSGVTPLTAAAQTDNLAVVRCLVELGADVKQAWGDDTPLILAAYAGKTVVVRCLVQLGAEVGAMDSIGDTAFILSATRQCSICWRRLVPLWNTSTTMGRLHGTCW
jgi:ankyrin repeat protein